MSGSHISLFSGVGMTDLAAERLGFATVATAEIDPFCRKVLSMRFPKARHYHDVKNVRRLGNSLAGVDNGDFPAFTRPLLVSGGFPCQDVSAIGTGAGLAGKRSGLWVEFARVIREFRPEWVLIENSPMLRSRGLDRVLCDLSDLGYNARWDCIPAASVGAPHLRDRIFIVAWPCEDPDSVPSSARDALGVAITSGLMSRAALDAVDGKQYERITKLPRAGRMDCGFVFQETPMASIRDAKKACLAHTVACPATPTGAWPTPAASIPQDGEKPETWLARREFLKLTVKNGNGAGMPLAIALKMFPTPRAAPNDWRTTKNAPSHGNGHGKTLAGEVNDLERAAGRTPAKSSESAGNVNPDWVEWLMGLPRGWTDLNVIGDAASMRIFHGHEGWKSEPHDVPRTTYPSKDRKARLMALGNGLVPQAAESALVNLAQ